MSKKKIISDNTSSDEEILLVPTKPSQAIVNENNKKHKNMKIKCTRNEEMFWSISSNKKVKLYSFKNMDLIDIREYYTKEGEELPGKKGISLKIDQFKELVRIAPEILKLIEDKNT